MRSNRIGGSSRRGLLAAMLWAAVSVAAFAQPAAPVRRQCGALEFSPTERFWMHQHMLSSLPAAFAGKAASTDAAAFQGAIPVVFHVVHDGDEGFVARDAIERQVEILNASFAPARFSLEAVEPVDNAYWFRMFPLLSLSEWSCKAALQWDPQTYLNVYTCLPYADLLGWAYFPFMAEWFPSLDGVVIDYRTLPGGNAYPYHMGDTLVHEVGHWAGLFHTFQGFCGGYGDGIEDTPAELSASRGCEIGRDTCPRHPGLDPIHNYMDYSDDDCADHFTPGQLERMMLQMQVYRPVIWNGLVPAK
jgi:hypothetical protein